MFSCQAAQVFWHQSEARTAATVWNWSGKTLSPGALLAVLYFSSCHVFSRPFRLFLVPTICPWVSEDAFVAQQFQCVRIASLVTVPQRLRCLSFLSVNRSVCMISIHFLFASCILYFWKGLFINVFVDLVIYFLLRAWRRFLSRFL